ncbi:MAG: hypothetical protein ACYC35_26835 [Pirellulales bacterium]
MTKYQVWLVTRPEEWEPSSLDDVPPGADASPEVFAEFEDLPVAVRRAAAYNRSAFRQNLARWAVVVEPGCCGKRWRQARLCTPIRYKLAAIWWPEGWAPSSPSDVPNCVWRAHAEIGQEQMAYPEAARKARALNKEGMEKSSTIWYVVIAIENEPVSGTVAYDHSGVETTTEVRRLHLVRLEAEGGAGSCAACPARPFDCDKADWAEQEPLVIDSRLK